MTRIVEANSSTIAQAAGIILAGGLVAFPTETVYGLGADALDPDAVQCIFAAKGRPFGNPLIVHIASAQQIAAVAAWVPDDAFRLMERFWPGPLTIVLPKSKAVPDIVTAGGDTVGVRVPRHPVALALLDAAGAPIAAPSANRSEAISPTCAEHVLESLGDAVELIVDGGPCEVGLESTVLWLAGGEPRILRPGAITASQIAAVIGRMPASGPNESSADAPARSPGQMPRHYAPTAALVVSTDAVRDAANLPGAAALVHGESTVDNPPGTRTAVLPADPAGYARELYAALRALDASHPAAIFVQTPPDGEAWDAIRDRLTRASHNPGRDR